MQVNEEEEEEEDDDNDDSAEPSVYTQDDDSESDESAIDETIYRPPKDSNLPIMTVISEHLAIPAVALGEMLAAYTILRAFSWPLRLSPFPFEDLAAALLCTQPTQLIDEIHICVLRALAVDETEEERADRKYDLNYLDTMTWPSFAFEFLRMTHDPLALHEWAQRLDEQHRGALPGVFRDALLRPLSENDSQSAMEAQMTSERKAFAPVDVEEMDMALSMKDGGVVSVEKHFADKNPPTHDALCEYYSLPIAVKATILSRLCDNLLDMPTIRAEVDRREAQGEFITGKGGCGGAFAIMTKEERARAEARAAKMKLYSDANADVCVLCGIGGSLICCDACPAAYHMRCIGENAKTLGDGDWFCPECSMGGRGEAAGLRIPPGARNKWKQPHHFMFGSIIRTAPPAIKSRCKHAQEIVEDGVPVTIFKGQPAEDYLENSLTRIRTADEVPDPSSMDAVADPPKILYDGNAGPEGYVNKYKNAWPAALFAIKTAIDDAKRRKFKGGIYIPTGTCGRLILPELPAMLPLSKFQWLSLQGTRAGRTTVRCGKCHTCVRPTLRKACLNPTIITSASQAPAESSKLTYLIAYVLRVEKEFWPLLEGRWAGGNGSGMAYRQQWVNFVRAASTVEEIAQAVVQLEGVLNPLALHHTWYGEIQNSNSHELLYSSLADRRLTPSTSAVPSRVHSGADLSLMDTSIPPPMSASAVTPTTPAVFQNRDGDPYSIRNEKLRKDGWEVDKNRHFAKAACLNRLPRSVVGKVARKAGWSPIPGVCYNSKLKFTISGRLSWAARTEAARTTDQLALCLRELDGVLQWDAIVKPRQENETPFYYANLLSRRCSESGLGHDYLVQMRPPPPMTSHEASLMQQRMHHLIQLQRMQHAMLLQQQANLPGMAVPLAAHPPPAPRATQQPMMNVGSGAQMQVLQPPAPRAPVMQHIQPPTSNSDVRVPFPKEERSPQREAVANETEALARKITEKALQNVLEYIEQEEMAFAPAAMAAKLRSRKSIGNLPTQEEPTTSGGAAPAMRTKLLRSKPSSNELSKAPSVPIAETKVEPVDVKATVVSQLIGMKNSHQPIWVHESHLPLWLIRTYEERLRREAANAAAREAANAARLARAASDAISNAEKEAARKAAQDAAAAAADACAVCNQNHGDNAALDALWICCDSCNRWFHGTCVAMTQEDVDSIAETQPWNCPGCWNTRRKQERASRRAQEAQQKLECQSPDGEGRKGPGRPPLPFYEKADYKKAEAKALEQLKWDRERESLGLPPLPRPPPSMPGHKKKKRRRGLSEPLSEEQLAAREALRQERMKRKMEAQEAAIAAAKLPIHCPVCQYPDYGRPLVQCDCCREQFHYECGGTNAEEVAAKPLVFRCLGCQGKRVRPPSDFAIQQAILAASGGSKDNSHSRKRQRVHIDSSEEDEEEEEIVPIALPPSVSKHTGSTWREAAQRVLIRLCRVPSAEPFIDPVSLVDVPDYIDVIPYPMDISTVRAKLKSYTAPLDVVKDVEAIWHNCRLYNGADSPYTEAAEQSKEAFERLWKAEDLPLTVQQWQPQLALAVVQQKKALAKREGGRSSIKKEDDQKYTVKVQPLVGSVPAPDWLPRAVHVLQELMQAEFAEPFNEPVPEDFENYHEVIENPMDLGTVLSKLLGGHYLNPNAVAADVALIWGNCRAFNERAARVVRFAAKAEAFFEKKWVNSGIFLNGVSSSRSAPLIPKDWKERVGRCLYRMNKLPAAEWFQDPVDTTEVPDYLEKVKTPMYLSLVSRKLKDDQYKGPEQPWNDVELIWKNAAAYNGPEHPVTEAAEVARDAFIKQWEKCLLPDFETGDEDATHLLAGKLHPAQFTAGLPVQRIEMPQIIASLPPEGEPTSRWGGEEGAAGGSGLKI